MNSLCSTDAPFASFGKKLGREFVFQICFFPRRIYSQQTTNKEQRWVWFPFVILTPLFWPFDGQAQWMSGFISRTNFKIKKHSNFLRAHKNLTNSKALVETPKNWFKQTTGKGSLRGMRENWPGAQRSAVPGAAFFRPVALDWKEKLFWSLGPAHTKPHVFYYLEWWNRVADHPRWGGGGTPPYKLYRHVPPQSIGNLVLFCLKTGIHFAHFDLESGKVRPVFVDKNRQKTDKICLVGKIQDLEHLKTSINRSRTIRGYVAF